MQTQKARILFTAAVAHVLPVSLFMCTRRYLKCWLLLVYRCCYEHTNVFWTFRETRFGLSATIQIL
jgi:hypothetical protein